MSNCSSCSAPTPLPPRRRKSRPDKLLKHAVGVQKDTIPMWFHIDTGSGTSKCFTQRDVPNFGFEAWRAQVPNCREPGRCSLNCQACSQSIGCSGQYCPSLREPRKLYTLGPKVSIQARGDLATQPYTFPLPLDYGGKNPNIPLNLMPWEGVP